VIFVKKLFGTDGIRGIVNEELTVELALKLGNAIGRYFAGKYDVLIIAKDTRSSADLLESALAAGASSAGINVEYAGVMPTPALAYITRKYDTIGVMISASHNPAVYNGIKVLERGMKIPDEVEVELENLMAMPMNYTVYSEVGKICSKDSYREEYIEHVVSMFSGKAFRNNSLIVDGANGAITTVLKEVYSRLGIVADYTFFEPNGININDGCGSLHPKTLGKKLDDDHIGVLFDGDADRCLFVLPGGTLIDGDMLMALNADKLHREGRLKNNTVVATVMSNLGFEKFLESRGMKLLRTRVGDKYVLEKMIETGSTLGGEQSGHIIFFDRSTTGDGLITSLETLNSLAVLGTDLREFYENFPKFPQLLKNVPVVDKKAVMECEDLHKLLEELKEDRTLRIVVRPSGTEPYIRVMVEGMDEGKVSEIVERIVEVLEDCSNE
jgi:phosphoglucosamine mutase